MDLSELSSRLVEARDTGKLNLSYLGAAALEDALEQGLAATGTRITELDLSSNELGDDALPRSLAAFPHLRVLRLKYNRLASLPLLAQLPHLEHLDLDSNQIAVVDEGALAGLPDGLRRLSLSSNQLRSLPDGMGVTCCRALLQLDVSNNPLTTLPDSLGSCPGLTHLDVSSCRLQALPHSLALARSLQRLFCQNNELHKVPTAFGHLSGTLKEWNLRANRLPLKYEQAREHGLAKFLAFLREEEEIERLEEIERNRPVGIASGPCTVYRCKAVLDDAVAAAAAGEPTEGFSWIRHGYAACQHGSSVYVWGGVVVREGRKTSGLLVLNLDTMEWRSQATRGDRPCPRDGHAMVVDDAGRHLLLFGGRKEAGGRRLAELHFLDLSSWTWFAPKIDAAAAPCPREQCTAAYAQGRLLVFGGRTNGARLNDLWAFCTDSFRWEQLPALGTAPSPRQGAAACVHDGRLWVMGGTGHFVLDDLFTYTLDTQEWQGVTIAGRSKAAARGGGHILTVREGGVYMYGGRDALGAQVSHLLRLKRTAGTRYEWAETEFCLLPNRSRIVLFDTSGRLCICQSGHPLHKLNVEPQQIERGSVIWDVTQLVPLAAVKDKAALEDSARASPKQERIRHATLIASKLPPPFSSHTPRERQLLAAAAAFRQRWLAEPAAAGRLPPCLVLPNECGVDKVVCATLRPTRLPHTELRDLDAICQFVAEFFTCEPLEQPSRPPSHLVSPWSLMEWQAGDSFDLATLACSLLLGAGYSAWVVVGYVPKQVAMGDQSRTPCPWIREHGLEEPAYGQLPEPEASFEADPEPEPEPPAAAAPEDAAGQLQAGGPAPAAAPGDARGAGAQRSGRSSAASRAASSRAATATPGTRPATGASKTPPAVAAPAEAAAPAAAAAPEAGGEAGTSAAQQAPAPRAPAAPAPRRPKLYVHAFVLVKPGRRDVCQPLLLDPCTGCQHSVEAAPCTGIEFAWDATNFWCNLQCSSSSTGGDGGGGVDGSGGRGSAASDVAGPLGAASAPAVPHGLAEPAVMDWTFGNPNCWLPLLLSKEEQHLEACTLVSHSSKVSGDAAPQRFPSRRPSQMLGRLPSIFSAKGLSPRNFSLVGGAAAVSAASLAAAAAGGSAGAGADRPGTAHGKAGVGLQLLAAGRNGTPRLGGGWPPTRDTVDSSLAYLSPDGSAMVQRSSAQLERHLPAGAWAGPLSGAALAAGAAGAAGMAGGAGPGAAGPRPPSSAEPQGHGAAAAAAAAAGGALPAPPEMPLSWVPALAVSRERLDSRCPRGEKAVQYRQARRELYARFGECTRWDGLVERLTTYSDPECGAPLCVLELFERRRDGLARRHILPAAKSSTVTFQPGAAACLRSLRTVRPMGQLGEVDCAFFHEARPDGLMRRQCSGDSMEEWFMPGSRPDGLIRRSVQYAASCPAPAFSAAVRKTSDAAAILAAAAAGASARPSLHSVHVHHRRSSVVATWDTQDRAVAFIHEQYRPPAAPHGTAGGACSSAPVLERRFEPASSRAQLVMQGGGADGAEAGRVARTYNLGGFLLEGAGGTEEERRQECAALRVACGAAQAAVRGAEEETRRILASRQRQEQGTLVETAFYDATRVKVEDSDGVEAVGEEEEDAYDFLHHFLPSTGARDMTAAEAEDARAACLAAFDDRMADRQRVLQSRLAESSAEVARLGAVLSSELQHLSPADQARVQAEEAAAAFRLHVVQRRAEEHPAQAEARRRELETQLAADKRLAAALAAGN